MDVARDAALAPSLVQRVGAILGEARLAVVAAQHRHVRGGDQQQPALGHCLHTRAGARWGVGAQALTKQCSTPPSALHVYPCHPGRPPPPPLHSPVLRCQAAGRASRRGPDPQHQTRRAAASSPLARRPRWEPPYRPPPRRKTQRCDASPPPLHADGGGASGGRGCALERMHVRGCQSVRVRHRGGGTNRREHQQPSRHPSRARQQARSPAGSRSLATTSRTPVISVA